MVQNFGMAASFSPRAGNEPEEPTFDKFDIYQTVPSSRPWKELKAILAKEQLQNSPPKREKARKETRILLHKRFADTQKRLERFGTFTEFKPIPVQTPRKCKIEMAMEPYFLDGSKPKVEEEKVSLKEEKTVTPNVGKSVSGPVTYVEQNNMYPNRHPFPGFVYAAMPWRPGWPVGTVPMQVQKQK